MGVGEIFVIGSLGAFAVIGLDYVRRAWREIVAEEAALPRVTNAEARERLFGDLAVPDEAKWTGRLNSLPGGEEASERIAIQSDTRTQDGPSQMTARGAK